MLNTKITHFDDLFDYLYYTRSRMNLPDIQKVMKYA